MTIHLDIPASIEQMIRADGGDVASAVREAALVEFYRRGLISHGLLAESLGMARPEVDALLLQHNVTEDLLSLDELRQQLDDHRRLAG